MVIIVLAIIATVLSFIFDKEKTWQGIKGGLLMFLNMLPFLFVIIVVTGVVLFFLPNEYIVKYLGQDSGALGFISASVIGSIALIPGCIVYPLAGMLVKSGVSYAVIAVFITTLKMVGILTLPLEAKYFGFKTALIRNLLYFLGALVIGLTVGFIL
jgi:uncharacterized membrane protein YraQ (UPF0718 family)